MPYVYFGKGVMMMMMMMVIAIILTNIEVMGVDGGIRLTCPRILRIEHPRILFLVYRWKKRKDQGSRPVTHFRRGHFIKNQSINHHHHHNNNRLL
jgi:hypothetical protein